MKTKDVIVAGGALVVGGLVFCPPFRLWLASSLNAMGRLLPAGTVKGSGSTLLPQPATNAAMTLVGGTGCRPGEMLIYGGTRSERCVPASSVPAAPSGWSLLNPFGAAFKVPDFSNAACGCPPGTSNYMIGGCKCVKAG